MPIIAKAPGKIILFGEHAVVYGQPAIACAINLYSYCKISKESQNKINSLFLRDFNYYVEFTDASNLSNKINNEFIQYAELLSILELEYKAIIQNLKIEIWSDLWPKKGMGSSASTSVAFIRALLNFFSIKATPNEINQMAYRMEKYVHGTPSGIDNNVCVFGGLIKFKSNSFERIKIKKNLWEKSILIIDSAKERDTGRVVKDLKNRIDKEPDKYWEIIKSIGKLSEKSIEFLKAGDSINIGKLMDENQKLLERLSISCPEIDSILQVAREYDIFGSKLTGAGRGGCVIVYATPENLISLQENLKKQNIKSILGKILYGIPERTMITESEITDIN